MRPMKSASAHFFTQAAVWLLFGVLTNTHAHGTYHDLVAAVSAQIEAEPDNAELYVKRSRLHLEHADWKAVLIDLERADRLAPGMLDADLVRGEALALAGKWQAALAVLNDLLKAHADQPQGLLQRARVLKQLKQDEPCLNDYRLALEKTSHPEPDLFNEAAEALMACGHGEEAVQVLQRGLKAFGAVPSLVLKAMEIETAAGHFDAALSRIVAMQKTAPRPEPWMAKRAQLLAQAGRREESRAAWQALATHLAALPNLERGSHAMSKLAEQAAANLAPPAAPAAPIPAPVVTPPPAVATPSISITTPPVALPTSSR
jgi:tetratricopeptide (TPR) repeat protein